MRVVITGATSMLGVALIKECINNGDEVLAIVRPNTTRIERLPTTSNIQIEYADLENLSLVQGDGEVYDVFCHFAWDYTRREVRDNPQMQVENIQTTLEAVKLAHKLGCKKFIGAGSQAEYGRCEGIINENTITKPMTAYGIAKLSANLLSCRLCEQLNMTHIWARIFSVYGINDNEGTMIDYALKQFMSGNTANFSSGNQIWNYLYEDDAGKMFYLLGKKDVSAGIYLIANDESKPLRVYIEEMMNVYGREAQGKFAQTENSVANINLNVDITKTVTATGYTPQVSFSEGIRKMVDSFSKK